MLKKKMIMAVVLVVGLFFLVLSAILMNRSYANENISSSTASSNDIMDITQSSNSDYVYFTITKKNNSASIRAIFDINLSDKHNEYSSKTITAKIEQSEDNSTFTQIANNNLSDGNNQSFVTVSQTPATVSYYRVSFYADSERLNLQERNIDVNISVRTNAMAEFNYEYQDNQEHAYEFEAPFDGSYTIELWGAAGNYYPSNMLSLVGKGAYTKGVIELTSGDKLYVYTGKNAQAENDFYSASFNAGSTTAGITGAVGGTSNTCNLENNSGSCHNNSSGGGATDVRLIGGEWNDPDSLASRIMVAAGGGGTQFYHANSNYVYGTGGAGGGLAGYEAGLSGNYFRYIDYSGGNSYLMNGEIIESDGTRTTVSPSSSSENYYVNTKHDFTFGGTQKRGGLTNYQTSTTTKYNGLFGVGGNGGDDAGGGGGGGYYGGAGGMKNYASSIRRTCHSPGSGGSSFISGHTGSISIENQNNANCVESGYRPENYVGTKDQSCSLVTYDSRTYQFTDTVMIDGEGYSWTNVRGAKTAMPSPDNREITTGNEGSGAARITYTSTAQNSLNTTWSKSTSINEVTVTANHYVEGTETPIKLSNGNNATSVIQNLHEGDSYTTSELSNKAEYYELVETPSNATGTVENTNVVVNYYYRLKSYNYTVNYVDKDTGASIHTAKTGSSVYGSTINATDEIISISTYTYDSADNSSITVGTNTGNNVINLYYVKNAGRVTIKYYDKATNAKITGVADDSITGNVGTSYNTESKKKTIEGYDYDISTNNTTGTITEEGITVIYYYKKKITVTANHYVEGTTTPIKLNNGNNSASVVQNLHEGDSYTTSELSNKAEYYELVSTPTNATGTVGSTNIAVNYYYRLKNYNYTVNYVDKDTGASIHTAKTGNTVYGSTINATNEIISISTYTYDSADSDSITIGTNVSNNVINLYYIKNAGRVTIKYYDKATNAKITGVADDVITGNVGTSYNAESKKKTIEGYDYDSSTNNTEGTISEEEITVIYYYKKKVTVTANHYIKGTTTPIKLSNGSNATSVVQSLHEGDSYTTSELSNKAEYYELVSTPTNAEGTVGSTNIVVTYYYQLKNYDYTVNYLDKDTGELIDGILPNTDQLPYGSTINASNYVIDINKYIYDSADKTSITIGTNANNNVINLYYVKKLGKLIVKYIDIVTNENILSTIVNEEKIDTSYNTTQKEIDGYTFIEVTGNTTGYYQLSDIEVVYKYAKNVVLKVNHIDKIKNEIMDTDTINAHEGESYHIGAKDYTGFVLVEKPEIEEGVFGNQNITLNYYYIQISSGVIEKHIDVFNNNVLYNKQYEGKEGDTYNVSSREFEGYDLLTDRLPTNNIGTMKVELQEVIYYYKKRASIKIKYVDDITGEEIIESNEITGYVNDEWKSNSLEIEGYNLVEEPDEEGRLGYINEDVVYRYRKIFKVITQVNGDGGSIEGDEDVLEKMSSTPNKIVITSGSKRFIEKVTINGIEIEITNTEKMILDNFTDMSEDKIIEVTFGEVVDVPKTSSNTLLPIAAAIMLAFGSLMIYLSLKKKRRAIKISN